MAKKYEVRDSVLVKYKGSDSEVMIPNNLGVTAIGEKAFYENKTLKKVILPEGVTEIGCDAFAFCANLSEVKLPQSLHRIGTGAFGYVGLIYLHLPASVTQIGGVAFAANTKLKHVYLPDSMSELGAYAFSYCGNLKELSLPYTLATIGDKAFENCPALKTLHIRKDGETITVPLERELDNAYWQALRKQAASPPKPKFSFDMSALLEAAKADTTPPPQTDPLERRVAALETELSTLRKLVISQQAQIAALMKRRERRKITSFHPLTEEELRRL